MSEPDPSVPPEKSPDAVVSSYDLTRLSWLEVERVLESDPRLLFAVGSLDQHGPHLPLGANALIADRVVREVSAAAGVLRAPTLPYGVGFPGSERYPGAAGLRRKTLHRVVNELLASWEDAGVRELVIVTAHRHEQHLDALLMALTSKATTTVVDLRSIPVRDILDGDPISEHGGEMETSLLLHLAPDRVRHEEIGDAPPRELSSRRYGRGRALTPPPASRGVVGRPSLATAEKGRRLFERFVDVLRKRVLESP